MVQRVRILIDNSLDNALTYPNDAQYHIKFARHLLHKYSDTSTRVNEDEEKREFSEKSMLHAKENKSTSILEQEHGREEI